MARWFRAPYMVQGSEELDQVRKVLLSTSPEGYVEACAAVRDMDQRDSVKQINVPTLVIVGIGDLATPPSDGQYLAEQIQGARYVELEGAHLSNIEASGNLQRNWWSF
ncbi:3-oxoadipate enol-lactonase 2 [Peribacillus sp. Bi96]|nr:3-oxoadipate enol-lactonase 2 [Peribacillus sp. Bi96]